MKRETYRYPSGRFSQRTAYTRTARRDRRSELNRLVLENRSEVYNLAYGLLGDPDLAVAATEDAFLGAFPALPRDSERASRQWLLEIAALLCQEYPGR
jgi:DNA-directed RNA polymerase specialized sigma24 family protein